MTEINEAARRIIETADSIAGHAEHGDNPGVWGAVMLMSGAVLLCMGLSRRADMMLVGGDAVTVVNDTLAQNGIPYRLRPEQ